MKILPKTHVHARNWLLAGAALVVVAIAANVLLGGTGGAIWIGLTIIGLVAVVIAMVWFISNPIRRNT